MVDLNASITDGTGKEIVEAIQAIAGGGVSHSGSLSDSLLMTIQAVTSYPGEGEDPYANTSTPTYWLPITFEELRTAVRAGKVVFMSEPSLSEGNFDFDAVSLYMLSRVYTDSHYTMIRFVNMNMETGDSSNFHEDFFIKNDDDYPQNVPLTAAQDE